ncbi:hypothetical protein R6Q59_015376 [Mikania micrantha]
MGKTTRFFKSLLGFKTTDSPSSSSEPNKQLNRRWSFGKSRRRDSGSVHRRITSKSIDGASFQYRDNSGKNEDSNKRAIALAAATAAVVDAAVAAAQAASEVIRMAGGTVGYGVSDELAAIKIQSCFRAYLARRALRALKALVKLQAVVRGHILRKQTADMMRRFQALIRVQSRACALRSNIACSTTNTSSHFHHHNSSKSYDQGITGQERMFLDGSIHHENGKIIETDTRESFRRRRLFQPNQISFRQHVTSRQTTSRRSSLQQTSSSCPCAFCEVKSLDDSKGRGVSTPVKSEGSRSCVSSISNHPNYMANTESSRAKTRSLSAPRLRPQVEVSNTIKRVSGYKYGSGMQQVPTRYDSFAKAYSGSARFDQHGMPVYDMGENEVCVGYWN